MFHADNYDSLDKYHSSLCEALKLSDILKIKLRSLINKRRLNNIFRFERVKRFYTSTYELMSN